MGINNYPDKPLQYCVNDADEIEGLLQKNYDGLVNFFVEKKINVSNSNFFLNRIKALFANENAEVALLYFSGHGWIDWSVGYIVVPSNDGKNNEAIPLMKIMQLSHAA